MLLVVFALVCCNILLSGTMVVTPRLTVTSILFGALSLLDLGSSWATRSLGR